MTSPTEHPWIALTRPELANILQRLQRWVEMRGICREASRHSRPAQVVAERDLEHEARCLEDAYWAWERAVERSGPEGVMDA